MTWDDMPTARHGTVSVPPGVRLGGSNPRGSLHGNRGRLGGRTEAALSGSRYGIDAGANP